jgi:hypothetical protein
MVTVFNSSKMLLALSVTKYFPIYSGYTVCTWIIRPKVTILLDKTENNDVDFYREG